VDGKWQHPRKQPPRDNISGSGGNIGTTMMVTIGNKDYNAGRAPHCCQRRQLVRR
jgi:hypothetical protein